MKKSNAFGVEFCPWALWKEVNVLKGVAIHGNLNADK